MKLERLDEPWIRTDADFINDDKFLAIDMHNALELRGKAYLVLLACAGWARMHPKSAGIVPRNVFDDICGRLWPTIRPQQIADALASKQVFAITLLNFAIRLRKQDKWQLSSELRSARSEAGRRGAITRWQNAGKSMASATAPDASVKQMALAMENKKGEGEVEGEDGKDSLEPTRSSSNGHSRADAVQDVFRAWITSTGKTGRTQLDDKRRKVIVAALKQYPVEDVLDAVEGWQMIPHNRGENDRQRPFNDIELLLRDAKHIELFRDARRGQVQTSGKVHRLDQWASDVLRGGEHGSQALR